MPEWRDQGCLLDVQPHGEGHALANLFTPHQGRVRALVYGGSGRKLSRVLQPGNQFEARWSARLEDQLGSFTLDSLKSRTACVMASRGRVLALRALAALLVRYVPEREAYATLYTATINVLDAFQEPDERVWMTFYALWEMTLLSELGYGLDLEHCAVTGQTHDLTHVSPKTGRVVCADVAAPYEGRLLELPDIFGGLDMGTFAKALDLSGYFLLNRIAVMNGDQALPSARQQLLQYAQKPASRLAH